MANLVKTVFIKDNSYIVIKKIDDYLEWDAYEQEWKHATLELKPKTILRFIRTQIVKNTEALVFATRSGAERRFALSKRASENVRSHN